MNPAIEVVTQGAKASSNYGLEVVLAIACAGMLFFVIKWVLRNHQDSMKHNQERELALAAIINTTLKQQIEAINQMKEAFAAQNSWAREAVARMREEHEEHARWLREIAERH